VERETEMNNENERKRKVEKENVRKVVFRLAPSGNSSADASY
jgi:hypothetical protein